MELFEDIVEFDDDELLSEDKDVEVDDDEEEDEDDDEGSLEYKLINGLFDKCSGIESSSLTS